MYEQYGLSDPFFLMLYGGAAMLALTFCGYMLVAFRSTLVAHVVPPKDLRYWTAAFFAAVAASHLWWAVLGIVWLNYVRALIQYGRWLRENYADLEHKEVWQSLLFLACVLVFYYAYTSNLGELFHEYLSQVNTLIILIFLSWRVETLQMLLTSDTNVVSADTSQMPSDPANTSMDIGLMLQNHCENTQL